MERTALLVMDVQNGTTNRVQLPENYMPLLSKVIKLARGTIKKVIYVTISFRPGHPEVNPANPVFGPAAKAGLFVAGSSETQMDPLIAPVEGDIVVEKKRVSAFTGSGLDIILRSLGIDTLVLLGLSTGGVVLSTVCEAADKDYKIVVLRDLCADPDAELHEQLMGKIFQKRGEVITSEEWLQKLKG